MREEFAGTSRPQGRPRQGTGQKEARPEDRPPQRDERSHRADY